MKYYFLNDMSIIAYCQNDTTVPDLPQGTMVTYTKDDLPIGLIEPDVPESVIPIFPIDDLQTMKSLAKETIYHLWNIKYKQGFDFKNVTYGSDKLSQQNLTATVTGALVMAQTVADVTTLPTFYYPDITGGMQPLTYVELMTLGQTGSTYINTTYMWRLGMEAQVDSKTNLTDLFTLMTPVFQELMTKDGA